jgi:DNA-binding transcriptional regulator LsrR (DeoR family)
VKNHQSKLNDDSVRAIRIEYAAGGTLKQIGARYGVSFALVGMIVRRKAWRHVA